MTFDARAETQQAKQDYPPFPFIGLDGETYELPHPLGLEMVKAEKLVQAQSKGDDEAFMALMDTLAPDAVAAIREMPQAVVMKLFDQWREGYGELGKSDSEPSPPNRAAKRSKQTSKSAA